MNRLVNELNSGTYIEPLHDTVQCFLSKWLEMIKPSLGGKTHQRYAEIVNRHLIPAFGGVLLAKLQPMHIQSYYSQALLAAG